MHSGKRSHRCRVSLWSPWPVRRLCHFLCACYCIVFVAQLVTHRALWFVVAYWGLSLGRIPAGAGQQILLTLRPTMNMSYDTQIVANVRGGKTVKFALQAQAEMPEVTLLEQAFDFGGTLLVRGGHVSLTCVFLQGAFRGY